MTNLNKEMLNIIRKILQQEFNEITDDYQYRNLINVINNADVIIRECKKLEQEYLIKRKEDK